MGTIVLSIPVTGQPNTTEDVKVANDLSTIQTLVNGNIDTNNVSPTAGILASQLATGVVPSGGYVFRSVHTFAITGAVAVASGAADLTNYIPPFFVSLAAHETAKIVKAQYVIGTGTSATCKLQKNAVDVAGFTGLSATTTAGSVTPTAVAVAENDLIALNVTAVTGSPGNLSFTIVLEHTLA